VSPQQQQQLNLCLFGRMLLHKQLALALVSTPCVPVYLVLPLQQVSRSFRHQHVTCVRNVSFARGLFPSWRLMLTQAGLSSGTRLAVD
jgi:hypothetical protein